MRFIVDEMPEKPKECPFFDDHECIIDEDKVCNRFNCDGEVYSCSTQCAHLKEA